MAGFEADLAAVRAAIEEVKPLAETFQTGEAKFYEDGNTTPVLVLTVRVKKPKPSSFDAGNQTEWSTKRNTILKAPLVFPAPYTDVQPRRGLIVQITTPDGDPEINNVNFVVQSALTGQFAAEREISVTTELNRSPKIVDTP